ncbi:hypothetical protein ACFYUV_03955 [Nonomuraea sp. NPDC003560]|uniref:hypothetical protein n=1 Tax=Nonomuraea sp. NPDC003560 TaxID=3364341 RepID=UPI0036ABC998
MSAMAATPLTPKTAIGPNGGPFTVPAPAGMTPRHALLAFIVVDSGGIANITGGGTWQRLGHVEGPTTHLSAVDVWWRMATASEPTTYTVTQGSGADGAVVIVPVANAASTPPKVVEGALFSNSVAVVTPGITPNSPSGAEIRFAAGIPNHATVSWSNPLSFVELADIQSADNVSGAVCWRPVTSTAAVGSVAHIVSGATLTYGAGLTVIVASGAEHETPTPPSFPAFTPAKGTTRWRYTVHDLLTGSYFGDIYPRDPSLDDRIGEPGQFSAQLPIPNRGIAARYNEIFPADIADLSAGPGRLVVHPWRNGVLYPIYWLHTAVTEQTARQGVVMNLQGCTLDGYLAQVCLTSPFFAGGDQLTAAGQLVLDMQSNPASNIGLTVQAGTSGVARNLEGKVDDRYGDLLQNFARSEVGFEYVVNNRVSGGSIFRNLEFGAPRIDFPDVQHVFTQARQGVAGDITGWREERSAMRGATRWGIVGGTPSEDGSVAGTPVRSTLITTPHIAAGWPIIDRRLQHPTQSTNATTLQQYAQYWAARAPGAPRVFSADVILGKGTTLGPTSLGEYVRFILNNPRYPITSSGGASFNVAQRLIGWQITPAQRRSGKDRAKLITAQEAAE